MAFSSRTTILIGLGTAIVAGLAYVSFREEPVSVDLAVVTRGSLEITVNADGKTKIRDLYEVASPISGTALRSPVEVGDLVAAQKTVVAVVQPSSSGLLDARTRLQFQAALQEALAARQVAQADLQQYRETERFAQSQFDRASALIESGVVSLTRLESDTQSLAIAKAAVEAAQARIDMADGTIERARASLLETDMSEPSQDSCCIEIRSPADGVVLSVAAMSQRPIAMGAALVSVGDPVNLELVADILSNDAVRLEKGALAYVERWGGPDPLLAKLDRIDPKARTKVSALGIEEQRVDAYFTLTSPPEDRMSLGDGFSVFLRIVEWRADDVLQIPLSAVFRDGSEWAVFVAQDSKAAFRNIALGQRNGQVVEILSGLEEGEKVVTHPSDDIAEGAALVERSSL
jgi:HlyD family secretion protein